MRPLGAVALHVPNSAPGFTALTDATQIVDFVQWSAGGGPNEATAAGAGLWTATQFVPPVAAGHSIGLCDFSARTAPSWAEIGNPNFGSYGNCTTPAILQTWGAIKQLYRVPAESPIQRVRVASAALRACGLSRPRSGRSRRRPARAWRPRACAATAGRARR